MARPIWKGSIAFGLVNVPVELHAAVRDARPHFHMLHSKDKSPVRFERVCVREGKAVAWADLVKGYEYEKGRFVVLTKEDLKAAALQKSRSIDIRRFVTRAEIDDRFFESAYFLVPAAGSERAYALLREAIRDSGRVGIATIVLRDAQHLAALEVTGNALVLTLMRYGEELVDVSQHHFPAARDLRKAELQMARTLVENLAGSWDPSEYADAYRDNLMKIIKARLKGRKAHLVEPAEPREARVIDLMERLRQSLQQTGKGSPRARKTPARGRKRAHAA